MRKLALILTLLLVISCLGCEFTALADTNAISFDNTDVLDDLKGSVIAGQAFDLNNFVYTLERETQVITFAEYGYHYDGSKQSNYALYVYVYNPSGKEIKSDRNTISIATVYENGAAVDYDKFALKLLSVSDGKYANLLYKFKVADVSKILARVSANSNVRRYDVAEIEINYGAETSEAFDVGNYYEYSGFAKGYGADATAESTLTCVSDSVDTLKLNVNSTYYRYNNYMNDTLSSVYFGVPSKTLEDYGKLQQIKANWFETYTKLQYVITDRNYYEYLKQYIGVEHSTLGKINERDIEKLFAKDVISINNELHTNNPTVQLQTDTFRWLFYSKDGNVSADEVLHYAQWYTNEVGSDDLLLGKYSSNLFSPYVNLNKQYGWQGTDGSGIVIDADALFDINGFKWDNKFLDWWDKLLYPDVEREDIKDVKPIYLVEDNDVLGDTATIAKKLLINEKDVNAFVSAYNANKVAGKRTVLFRFAVRPYRVAELIAQLQVNDLEIPGLHNKQIGYVAQSTAFLDFDVIWLKFVKEAQETIIPTVAAPTDIFTGLTPPPETQIPWWVWLIIACIVLLVLILLTIWVKPVATFFAAVFKGLWLVIKYLFIGLHYVVASPVYLIAWIVEKAREKRGG